MRLAPVPWVLLALALAAGLAGCVEGEESADGPMDGDVVPQAPDTLPDEEEEEGEGDVDAGSAAVPLANQTPLEGEDDLLGEAADLPAEEFPRILLNASELYEEAFTFPNASDYVTLVLVATNPTREGAILVARMTGPGGTTAMEGAAVPPGRDTLVRLTLQGEDLEGQEPGVEVAVRLESDRPLIVSGSFYFDGEAGEIGAAPVSLVGEVEDVR